jgi:hypothetical protein
MRTHTSHRLAFRRHTDYACAVTVYPRLTWLERFMRLVGFRHFRNYE